MIDHDRDGSPWWASGADDLRDEVDPFDAHRRAREQDRRSGDSRGGSARRSTADDAWQGGRGSRPGLEEAAEAIGALARAAARRAGGGRADDPRAGRGAVHDPACRSCPVCMVTRSLGDARPEVVEHLELAARHLVLAARALVDAAEERTGWERIELDEDESAGDAPDRGGWSDAGRQTP